MTKVLILLHMLLALVYGLVVPPYEAHDETGHFAYVRHIVVKGYRPDARSENKAFLDQSHQPPLYYIAAAAFTAWARPALAAAQEPPRNVFAFDGSNRRGVRILLRRPGEDFPWSAEVAALHAARVASALLSTLMLVVIAASARMLFPSSPGAATLTVAFAAFNPQVVFMAAMVNNDVMVALSGACVIWALLRLARPQPGRAASVLLGAALGMGLLSKNSALALPPFAAVALVWIARHNRWSLRTLLTRSAVALLVAGILSAPLYIDNYATYGTLLVDRAAAENKIFTQQNLFVEGLGVGWRDSWLPQLFTNSFRTFWGAFGWGSLQQPDWVYSLVLLVCVIGIVGLFVGAERARAAERTALVLLGGLGGAVLLLPLYRAIAYQDPALLPGRYLMPALTTWAGLLGFGWSILLHRMPRARRAVVAALIAWAAALPPLLLIPAYRPALVAAPAQEPLVRFGDVAEVHALSAETIIVQDREGPRPYAHVRVTWMALRRTSEPYVVSVAVLGRDAEVLGAANMYPQRGNLPSTVWSPGDAFTDEFFVLLEKPCAQLPALGRVEVAMYTIDDELRVKDALPPRSAAGDAISPILGRFRIDAPAAPYPIWWQEPRARFDGALALRDVRIPEQHTAGAPLTARIDFELLAPLARDAVVFLHATAPDGTLIAQDDHAPLGGAVPTSLWNPGECARETFTLAVPADYHGPLHLWTGWYDPAGRLVASTAFDPAQPRFPDDRVPVGIVEVTDDR
jgi:4-amino-4-deoxy-L-arabinose transferase-like glycosyltransferase